MKRHLPLRAVAALLVLLASGLPAFAQSKAAIVPSALSKELVKLFPDLSSGYIDFSGNGKPDQTADLNEVVPESRVRDGQLQAQEILDFIVANWRFIPLERLRAVQAAVKASPGAIGELIAIDYSASLGEAIARREEMGDGLYLTPSAYKEAMGKIGGIVSAMAAAYKKEGQKAEADFVAGRDALFAMVDKGYPLPKDLPEEERAVLSTAMVGVMLKEKGSSPARSRAAIRVLGQLKSAEAAPYLVELAAGTEYPIEAMRALAEIGYKPAIPVLAAQLRSAASPEVRKAALQATGAIGGAEGLDAVLEIAKPANREGVAPDLLEAAAQALAGIAQKGNPDPRVQASLRELAGSDRPAIRKIAAGGIGAFATPQSAESLLLLVGNDKDVEVRKAAVAVLGRQKAEGVMPALMKLLKEQDLDPALEAAAIQVVGEHPSGALAVQILVDALADRDAGVRAAASAALKRLFPANQALVTGSLTRSLLSSQDEGFLVEGTALLASIADPSSLATLLALLQKPQSEVKRNAAWALYRIRSSANVKVVEELQKLVTNENESLAVRANAVRALGAIGYDSPQLNVAGTLVTTAQMRGEKYAMLRYFAVRALGRLGPGKGQAAAALARIASRDPDPELRKEAVSSLKELASASPEALESLAASYALAEDQELKVRVIEALADLGSDRPASLGAEFLSGEAPAALKRRVIQAVSQAPSEASAAAILDAARDPAMADFAAAVLEGFPAPLISSIVARRLRTETDKGVLSVLASLDARFAE